MISILEHFVRRFFSGEKCRKFKLSFGSIGSDKSLRSVFLVSGRPFSHTPTHIFVDLFEFPEKCCKMQMNFAAEIRAKVLINFESFIKHRNSSNANSPQ